MNASLISYIRYAVPLVLGLLALGVPLLRDFHLESALLASVVGCSWAGWKAADPSAKRAQDLHSALAIVGYLYLFGVPLLIYTLVVGCFSFHGLGLWLLYPLPSVFFGYAVGRLCRLRNIRYPRAVAVAILLCVAAGVFLVEFFSFPQVYFFNHVWGGWPGPIYDETVQVTTSLLFFRLLTFLWILLLWFLPTYGEGRRPRWIFWLSVLALGMGYSQLAEMGIVSPESYIRQQLGGVQETEHFVIYYDRQHYSREEVRLLALEHEFYLNEISKALDLTRPDSARRIHSYLYAHPWQKKRLVGAKFTSYVPVWLSRDQLHIAKQQTASSLRHEMVHVLAKQFGNRLFNASWSIGLVEGIAVALAPDESFSSTIDQIVASEKPYPVTEDMRRALLPSGFYGGRSSVNYTTSGSFVRYLLRHYPVENFKQAYRSGDIEAAYGVSLSSLVEGWHEQLDVVKVDSLDRRVAQRMFSLPSLFEQQCPRILSEFAQHWDQYNKHMAEKDTTRALKELQQALEHRPDSRMVKAEWAYQNLRAGNTEQVQFQAKVEDPWADLQLLYADALAIAGEEELAARHLSRAAALLDGRPNVMLEEALATRADREQWKHYMKLVYKRIPVEAELFSGLYYRSKMRAVEEVIQARNKNMLLAYAEHLLSQPVEEKYFNRYASMIHWLGFYGEKKLADAWLNKLREEPMRERHRERLEQERRWVQYVGNRR